MSLICVASKDDNFLVNKEYKIDEGYIYTEYDISINTTEYSSEDEAISDLKKKGYEFKRKGIQINGGSFGDTVFGDLSSFMESLSPGSTTDQKKSEAESLKNDMLNSILKRF